MMDPKRLIVALAVAALAATVVQPSLAAEPQQFVIEREMPGVSKLSPEQLRDASRLSNRVLKELGPDIQWVHSYVAGDKIYCVYNAPNEDMVREHAKRAGFPASKVTPVAAVINPTTAR